MRVIFLGTPDFAVNSLDRLCASHHEVVAVITQPDQDRGRLGIQFPPVKEYAIKQQLPVYQFKKLREEGVGLLKELNADVLVTCAYGQIISQEILDMPKYGVINVHASLLPKYRGSSPIQWAIINGERETGVTIMKTAYEIDSGDMILQKSIEIGTYETAGQLFDRLSLLGAEALIEALDAIQTGSATYTKQNHDKATHVSMLKKEDGKINWNKTSLEIKNQIYGMNPWPCAYTSLNGKVLKVWTCEMAGDLALKNGEVKVLNKECFVGCQGGSIKLKDVQMEGKKRMDVVVFMLGQKLDGEMLI